MLVLERGIDERITVEIDGKKMDIVILMVKGKKVKIGFDAPKDFSIVRDNAKKKD